MNLHTIPTTLNFIFIETQSTFKEISYDQVQSSITFDFLMIAITLQVLTGS